MRVRRSFINSEFKGYSSSFIFSKEGRSLELLEVTLDVVLIGSEIEVLKRKFLVGFRRKLLRC